MMIIITKIIIIIIILIINNIICEEGDGISIKDELQLVLDSKECEIILFELR